MNTKEIKEQNIIERYILNELDEETKIRFEEYLLYNEDIRMELGQTEKLILGIQEIAKRKENEENIQKKKSRIIPMYYKIAVAASFILAFSISYLLVQYNNIERDSHEYANLKDSLQIERNRAISLEKGANDLNRKYEKTTLEKDSLFNKINELVANNSKKDEAFQKIDKNRWFENPNIRRGTEEKDFILIEPKSFISLYSKDSTITFTWQTSLGKLSMLIINDKGKEAMPIIRLLGNSYVLKSQNLVPGIYRYEIMGKDLLGYGYIVIE